MFGIANKKNTFSFADGLWNEPNYDEHYIEQIKEILGGNSARVN